MDLKLKNKTALVTGGGSGIGERVSVRFAEEGAHVIVLDLNLRAAETVADKIIAQGGKATPVECDISNHAAVSSLFSKLLENQPIDILVNNAGIAHVGSIENTSDADMDRIYSVNVKGVYNATHALIPSMRSRQYGVIVNMASIASTIGIPDRFAYSMSKGAVLTMTLAVATDYVHDGIRCNSIAPGRVHTPFVDAFLEKNYPDNRDEMFQKLSKTQPIGRMGDADEIANLVLYLSSDVSAFITGSNFAIDGGFATLRS